MLLVQPCSIFDQLEEEALGNGHDKWKLTPGLPLETLRNIQPPMVQKIDSDLPALLAQTLHPPSGVVERQECGTCQLHSAAN